MSTSNNKLTPLFVASSMPKPCYDDVNEFVADLAKVLQFPEDSISVIKGAKGDPGERGEKGARGLQGEPGQSINKQLISVNIPNSVSYVEFDIFNYWQHAIYNIIFSGTIGGSAPTPQFDPDAVIGVGTIVPVHATPSPTKLRCYFVFKDGEVVTQDNNHILQIIRLS